MSDTVDPDLSNPDQTIRQAAFNRLAAAGQAGDLPPVVPEAAPGPDTDDVLAEAQANAESNLGV